ncbi:TRAP transporter small permease [Acuticoccus kandeliae]|uniref:TRAP transporter small permease n=1 Tax=Acuticoccus kandeliae TaxID=2073160 RepID=UPI0013003154|nr:TRAP transporter small permease subunit [Acuticoccus kandeliae]
MTPAPVGVDLPDAERPADRPAGAARPRKGVLDRVDRVMEVVALTAFAIMMLSTLTQVFARYLAISADWTEEFARVVFLSAMMIGMALAVRREEHIVVDFFFGKLAPRPKAMLTVCFDIAIIGLLVLWLRGALILMQLNANAIFVTLPWLSVAALYAVEAFGVAMMIVFILADIVRQGRLLKAGDELR